MLRKFKKLVPECRWNSGRSAYEYIPFVDHRSDIDFCILYLNETAIFHIPQRLVHLSFQDYITASDFLRDDWKLEDKSELLTKLKVIQDQVNELEKLIKKESI